MEKKGFALMALAVAAGLIVGILVLDYLVRPQVSKVLGA